MSFPTVKVFPVPGRKLGMPELNNQPVPAEGAIVALNSYYVVALRVGDVTEEDPAAPKEEAAPSVGEKVEPHPDAAEPHPENDHV